MKTTRSWLAELVPSCTLDASKIADLFTMSGTELETMEKVGDDWMIDLAVTSNRVDCYGAFGLARELSVVTGCPVVRPEIERNGGGAPVEKSAKVTVDDQKGCPRYTALVVRGVKIGPSPEWLKTRLETIGLRSINNVVDATNWVLFEMNQPIHAFDLDRVAGGHIIVRRAKAGEKISALNGKEYELTPDMLAICDEKGPTAIAGVMGGAHSEISDKTTNVLIETAAFDMHTVRATSRKLGLTSDSSYRFERGLDPYGVAVAAQRCAHLVLKVAGGELASGMIDVCAPLAPRKMITFRYPQIQRITGVEIEWSRAKEILVALGFEVAGDPSSVISITVPTWRADVDREIDVIEELIRVEGLHFIPTTTEMKVFPVKEPKPEQIKDLLRRRFVGAGFVETLTTSFVSEKEAQSSLFAETEPIIVRNAMRSDENALRQSLLPSLLRARKTNQDHGNADVRLFEITVIYLQRDRRAIPEHLPIVGFLIDGGFRDGRGMIELLAQSLRIGALQFRPLSGLGHRLLEDSGGAEIYADADPIGWIGRPRAQVLAEYDLKSAPIYVELRLDRLIEKSTSDFKFVAFSRQPAAHRDLAIVIDEHASWGAIEATIRSLGIELLESLAFNEEYRGKQVPPGKKSLFFSLVYRAMDRTLTSEEVDAEQTKVIATLTAKLGAEVRK